MTLPKVDQAAAETLTAAELEAEARAWQAAYEANREEFHALARQALEELDAGETLGLVVHNGKIYPQ